jgi:signal transduction histidine kinase
LKIQTKVILAMIGVLLVTGILGGGTLIYLQRRASESHFQRTATVLASAVRSSLEQDMLEANPRRIQDTVARLGQAEPLLTDVRIFDPKGMVAASTVETEIRQPKPDAEVQRVFVSGQPSTRISVDGPRHMDVLAPVISKPACQRCHDPAMKTLGVIEVGLDRAPLTALIQAQSLLLGVFMLAGALIVTGVLVLMFRVVLTCRLSNLAEATAAVAQGDYSIRTAEKGQDEIGALARSFDRMAESLDQRSRELAELHANLEKRVRERTLDLEESEKARAGLLQRLTLAQEEERARVARELHDEIGQALTAVALSYASAAQRLPPGRAGERALFLGMRESALEALRDVRRIIAQLRPEALYDLGLPAALRWMCEERLKDSGLDVKVEVPDLPRRLGMPLEMALYRVAQEALSNALRHSGATKISLSLALEDGTARLEVVDNGGGFDPGAVLRGQRSKEGWGLLGMRERLLAVGGNLQIDSAPGRGTAVRVTVPLSSVGAH